MTLAAARTDIRVVRFVRRLEPRAARIADVVRATGRYCDHAGFARPSYEQIRLLVHAARDRREHRRAVANLLLEVNLRSRPPDDLLSLLGDPRQAPGSPRRTTRPRRR